MATVTAGVAVVVIVVVIVVVMVVVMVVAVAGVLSPLSQARALGHDLILVTLAP